MLFVERLRDMFSYNSLDTRNITKYYKIRDLNSNKRNQIKSKNKLDLAKARSLRPLRGRTDRLYLLSISQFHCASTGYSKNKNKLYFPWVRLLQGDVNDGKFENKFQKYLTRLVSLLFHLWSSSMWLKYPPNRYSRLKTSISEEYVRILHSCKYS